MCYLNFNVDKLLFLNVYGFQGWSSCSSISMFHFFMSFEDEEKRRIRDLEMFDEYEMWHEKCHHYLLIWASQGSVKIPEMFQVKSMYLNVLY